MRPKGRSSWKPRIADCRSGSSGSQTHKSHFHVFSAWRRGHQTGCRGFSPRFSVGCRAGAALILQVGDTLPFVSRRISGAPATGESTNELLLDGQQRITALWRALTDGYEDRIYFAAFNEGGEDDAEDPKIEVINVKFRHGAKGQVLPQWIEDPAECWSRGYVPMRLLRPGDMKSEVNAWVGRVVDGDLEAFMEMQSKILSLRECVSEFNLPYLALPPSTAKDVALDVFIKMNTSAVVLTAFDIIVAQAEATTGESIHDLVQGLERVAPQAKAYRELPDLILDTAALMQDRNPNNTGYVALDLERMVGDWEMLVRGVEGMVRFLGEEGIYDRSRLPTTAVLPVIASLWPVLPTSPDALGEARRVLRKYLWRSSFTDRYESAAASKALNDRRALLSYLEGRARSSRAGLRSRELSPAYSRTARVGQVAQERWDCPSRHPRVDASVRSSRHRRRRAGESRPSG